MSPFVFAEPPGVLITASSGEYVYAQLVLPYEATWRGRNVVHELIGGGIAIARVAPMPRSGQFVYVFDDETDAYACAALHRQNTTLTLSFATSDHHPDIACSYIVDGDIRVTHTDADHWRVPVDYLEVTG